METTTSDASNKETGVALGFVEEADTWQLRSPQFPSKVGGRPAWLSLSDFPSLSDMTCAKCKLPTAFLLQVYAPIVSQDWSFHRTIFVFCCKTPTCHTRNDHQCFKGRVTLKTTKPNSHKTGLLKVLKCHRLLV